MRLNPPTEKILVDFLLITLAIFIPYHQVAQHTFTDYDDGAYLFRNSHIGLGLTWDNLVWAFTDTDTANWYPLTWISHLVDHELFGAHPGGYLLMNVAWHTLAACLCYLAFFRCTKSRIFALTVALIFALHPVNVENVAWASERKSILNAAFWFAAILAYLDFISTKSLRAYGLTLIFFICSLMSKAMSVTLPCTLALMHCLYLVYHPAWPNQPEKSILDWKPIVRPILPLLFLSLYFSAVTASVQTIAMPENFSFSARLVNAIISYERYLVMFFHPTELAFYYPLHFDKLLTFRSAIPALLILVSLSSVTLLLIRKKPQLAIGWCWFLGTMVPAIGLVQVGGQSHADRYLYIPMLGLAFLFPVLFEMLGSLGVRIKNVMIGVSLAVMGASMLMATQIQVSYWKDGVTLCLHSLGVTGYCFNPVLSLSQTYTRTGRFDEYFAFIDSTIAAENNPYIKGMLATMKANVLYTMGKYAAAEETAQRAITWGSPNKASYALVALSSYALGHSEMSAQFLAAARAAPEPSNVQSMLSFPLKPKLDWLEMKLKEKIPLKAVPTQNKQ